MIALGMGNILGSFFGSMPITASFGRSSVQSASGVKTPLSNIYAGSYFPRLGYNLHSGITIYETSTSIFNRNFGIVGAGISNAFIGLHSEGDPF